MFERGGDVRRGHDDRVEGGGEGARVCERVRVCTERPAQSALSSAGFGDLLPHHRDVDPVPPRIRARDGAVRAASVPRHSGVWRAWRGEECRGRRACGV